ncbi:MAG: hypothetical protein EXS36_17820 [Pedosphaera sp.]|nr:hypothetical protein [Pedosphaera sp.]
MLQLCAWIGWSAMSNAAVPPPKPPVGKASGNIPTDLFEGPVQRWDVRLTDAAIESLAREPRTWVTGSVQVGIHLFDSVRIHLKGSVGSFRPIHANPGFTLNFSRLKEGQSCFGNKKLHLNNSAQDSSRLAEIVCADLYHRAGIPTPRAGPALVALNGVTLGPYVLKEAFDKAFLLRHFKDASGNLYDGGFLQDIDQELERDSGDGPEDRADLHGLVAALQKEDLAVRLDLVGKRLQLDTFVTYTALQILTDDWDGYVRNRNNYRLYHDPIFDRFHFLPHGMDQMFEQSRGSLRPSFQGLAAQSVFGIDAMRERLYARMSQLTNSVFTAAVMTNVLWAAENRLQAAMAGFRENEREFLLRAAQDFEQRILVRLDTVHRRNTPPSTALRLTADGKFALVNWKPRSESTTAKLEERSGEGGHRELHIRAGDGETIASWRTSLNLPQGPYRFLGRARTRGVKAIRDGLGTGAGLRISRETRWNQLSGTTDWKEMSFDFELEETREVEFVLELRAEGGDVAFDVDSLRIQRR